MLGPIMSDRQIIMCNRFECIMIMTVEASADPSALRRAILGRGWLINMENAREEILIGQEETIAAGFGFSPEQIEQMIVGPRFDLANDKHYCSLDCAATDA